MTRPNQLPPEIDVPATTVWRAISKFLAWLVALALVGLGLACFKPQLGRQARFEAELNLLKAEKNGWEEQNRLLNTRIEWLKHDSGYLEAQARDRLDLAGKDEVVVRFEPAQ